MYAGRRYGVPRLLCFAYAPDLTGYGLARQLLMILADAGIMVGQGYDGGGAMAGKENDVQKHVRDACPAAVNVHCIAHCLNLCLSKASDVPSIRSAATLMNELAVFFCDQINNLKTCSNSLCPNVHNLHTLVSRNSAPLVGWKSRRQYLYSRNYFQQS